MNHELRGILDRMNVPRELSALAVGNRWRQGSGAVLEKTSPIDNAVLAKFAQASGDDAAPVLEAATNAFSQWREVPPPARGQVVREIGEELRRHKSELAELVTLEAGKIRQEALGEVQEMIDVCDFAVGLSRQLYGLTIASERPQHRLAEQWHPLGPIGVITAFNFPVAVWAWNTMIALVCGDPVVWKPSEKTPLCAMACHALAAEVLMQHSDAPEGLLGLMIGGADVGQALAASPQLPLVSATGSVPMGRAVAQTVAARLGRSLLELGGNNGMVITPSADLELAVRAIVFAAVGTCGQRCTTLRRLIVHKEIADRLTERLQAIYGRLKIGDPRSEDVLVGPLIDGNAWEAMNDALHVAAEQGGQVFGGQRLAAQVPAGVYVQPAIVEIGPEAPILQQETFAPILYVIRYRELAEAIKIHNAVPQGLASAIFTNDVREAERFCSAAGSDCGIVNVNIGTSGAEIGGAFGGEKDTGGGRESGSDAWKAYMRRATNTVNYSTELPLAQGIRFDLD